MTDQSSVPSISMDERPARFVLFSRWIRRSGNTETVKADAFIPHPYPNLSVTRHLLLSEQACGESAMKSRRFDRRRCMGVLTSL